MNNGSKIPSPTPTQGKPIKCRAAVSRQPGEPLLIEEIEVDPPKIGEGWEKTIIFGVEKDGAPFKVNSYEIINGMSITNAVFGGLKPKSDIPMLIQKYLDKELHLDELISHEVSFEDINKAFHLLLWGMPSLPHLD